MDRPRIIAFKVMVQLPDGTIEERVHRLRDKPCYSSWNRITEMYGMKVSIEYTLPSRRLHVKETHPC